MRSKLFVPASRPEFFDKALAGQADGLSFDLEDAVAPARKPQARQDLSLLIASGRLAASGKTIVVRVNALDTPWFADDIAAVVRPGVHWINLPKPADAGAVRAAGEAIDAAERGQAFETPIRLLLNIESPKALRTAHELAAAHPRVAGLQLGLGDLFEPLAIERREPAAIQQAMFALRMAAGEAGVLAYDAAFANVADAQGYRDEAGLARRLGFAGKSCIHPSQVALANEVFRPQDDEIAHSLAVLEAAQAAEGRELGAFMVRGRMVDAPFVARAREIVALATRLGLIG